MRQRQCITLAAVVFCSFFAYSSLRLWRHGTKLDADSVPALKPSAAGQKSGQWEDEPAARGPRQTPGSGAHPIALLVKDAQRELDEKTRRQSRTLQDAVREYRRRYGMPPPPHFDKWFEFARGNGVQLVDEFDTLHDLLTPFWGLKPKAIRARVKEALGHDNGLIGVAIRDHQVSHMQGGPEWQQMATQGMMAKFIQHLPDMDLAFNVHDEPRVMVPYDDLTRLVHKARTETMAASRANKEPTNDFSPTSPELSRDKSFDEAKLTRFNVFSHQATWTHSRMSCSPDSPARALEEEERNDDVSRYAIGELGFVYNATAMSDICFTPSLSSTHGFFDRPNSFKVVHDLFPIFSQSKISSYNDIIYPSPWYWYEKVSYQQFEDRPWGEKHNKLYWRGSTTGGFSRRGSWRRQHRQHAVQKMNARDQALIMVNTSDATWQVKTVPRGDYQQLIDVHFSHVGQCDPGDCAAQTQFFDVKERVEQHDAWAYKFLLDMDGNAFSGRFYAFLKSQSLTFKLAVFREWHSDWLKAWAHYVPLSPQGNDWLEAVRFFADTSLGNSEAERIAVASRDWANKVVRKEDMEAWLFRLLLEYARVIDDQREIIGFDPSSADKKLK